MIKKLMNKDANANNTRVVYQQDSGCCPDLNNCLYELDLTGTKAVTALVLENSQGVQETYSFASASSVAGIQSALLEALETAGYTATSEDVEYPAGDGVLVTDAGGGTYTVQIFGDAVALKIVSNSNDFTFTKKCDEMALYTCSFIVDVDTEVGDMAYAGSTETIGDASGYASGEASALEADVETALGNLGIPFDSVTATYEDGEITVVMELVGVECSLVTVGAESTTMDGSEPWYES